MFGTQRGKEERKWVVELTNLFLKMWALQLQPHSLPLPFPASPKHSISKLKISLQVAMKLKFLKFSSGTQLQDYKKKKEHKNGQDTRNFSKLDMENNMERSNPSPTYKTINKWRSHCNLQKSLFQQLIPETLPKFSQILTPKD